MRLSIERWGWAGVAVATAGGAFLLPFCFPLRTPVFSETYMAGADNRAAAVAVAAVGLVVLGWRWGRQSRDSDGGELGAGWLVWAVVLATAVTAVLGWLVVRAHCLWGDEGYFVQQLRTGVLFHRLPYRDFEFPYGPALYWWAAGFVRALGKLGVSVTVAYLVSLAVMQAMGFWILFQVERWLPLRTMWKKLSFGMIAAASVTPLLGMNYTLVRFVLPLAVALWLERQKTVGRALGVAALGEAALLAVSPELGVAFAAGCLLYGGYRAVSTGWRWAGVPLGAAMGAALFAVVVGRDYFLMLSRIAGGEYNLLIEPAPFTLLLLAAAVGLAPLAVARQTGGRLLAFYGVTLGLLPAALGRCDPVHTFFDGIGLYLLACVAVQGGTRRAQWIWGVALATVLGLSQVGNLRLYRNRLELAVRAPARLEDGTVDAAAILREMGSGTITAPRTAPLRVEEQLTQAGVYRPGYFAGMQGVWDREAELRVIAGMRASEFTLIPLDGMLGPTEVSITGWRRAVGFARLYHARRVAYVQGALVEEELRAHWVAVAACETYVLFRRVS